jgi:hypothetical protein
MKGLKYAHHLIGLARGEWHLACFHLLQRR